MKYLNIVCTWISRAIIWKIFIGYLFHTSISTYFDLPIDQRANRNNWLIKTVTKFYSAVSIGVPSCLCCYFDARQMNAVTWTNGNCMHATFRHKQFWRHYMREEISTQNVKKIIIIKNVIEISEKCVCFKLLFVVIIK